MFIAVIIHYVCYFYKLACTFRQRTDPVVIELDINAIEDYVLLFIVCLQGYLMGLLLFIIILL